MVSPPAVLRSRHRGCTKGRALSSNASQGADARPSARRQQEETSLLASTVGGSLNCPHQGLGRRGPRRNDYCKEVDCWGVCSGRRACQPGWSPSWQCFQHWWWKNHSVVRPTVVSFGTSHHRHPSPCSPLIRVLATSLACVGPAGSPQFRDVLHKLHIHVTGLDSAVPALVPSAHLSPDLLPG